MARPASNRGWCVRWDELSVELLEELEKPDCNVAQVRALIRERRILTTASPVHRPGESPVPEDEQREWLRRSLEREERIVRLAEEVKGRLGKSVVSLQAGRAVRSRFNTAETRPRVFSTRL